MVRLSEALARLHCNEIVQPKYVHEAFRLLKQSIIHVESENIDFDDPVVAAVDASAAGAPPAGVSADGSLPAETGTSAGGAGGAGAGAADSHSQVAPSAADQASHSQAAAPRAVSITYEKYAKIARMLITELRRREELDLARA